MMGRIGTTVGQTECRIARCGGVYQERKVMHLFQDGEQAVVVDGVPTLVCSRCGHRLLQPETLRRVESTIRMADSPNHQVPVYEYKNWL